MFNQYLELIPENADAAMINVVLINNYYFITNISVFINCY